jgi:hypothetical protein
MSSFLRLGMWTKAPGSVPAARGSAFFSRASGKTFEESVQIAPENYPPFAVSPREQITGRDGRIKPCATDAGHRAGFRD